MTTPVGLEHVQTPTVDIADEASDGQAQLFSGPYQHVVVPVGGHILPQEKPRVVVDAVLTLLSR